MKIKAIATTALMASVALTPMSPLSSPAHADGKDFIAGAIIGGIVGGAIVNEKNKKKSTKSTKTGVSSETREENKEVQTALNYFGYPVGTPDGAIGPKSRAAIAEYQAFLGYPATGELTEHERTILVTSYHRAVAGGPTIASTVSGSVYGLKAVLIAQRDEMAGVAPTTELAADAGAPVAGSVAEAAAAALPTLLPEAEVAHVVAPVVEVAVVEEAAALPSFIGAAGAKGSLAEECNQINVTTNMNGGMTTADTMQDANFALAEQFCLARAFAITTGDELVSGIAGFTPAQIAEQCAAFGPLLKDNVAALSLRPADEVLAGVESFILTSGMAPAQLSGTAKVCLGVGYANDDLDVAIGSALLLTAMGERGYAEYLGHHLAQGFGATERPDLAMGWYDLTLEAMGQGQMVVAPGVAGRDTLIKKAAYTINGRAGELVPEAVIEEASLPVFEVAPEVVAAEGIVEEAAVAVPVIEAPATDVAVTEPEAAPVFVAPELAEVVETAEAAPVAESLGTPDTSVVNAGAQAAIMAARLPFLIFSSY